MIILASFLILASVATTSLDDIVAHTADGREVVLKENGTWEFVEAETTTEPSSAIESRQFGDILTSVVSYREIQSSEREPRDDYSIMSRGDITVVYLEFENVSETRIVNINGSRFGYNEATGEGFYYNKPFVLIDEFDNRFEIAVDGLRLVQESDDLEEEQSGNSSPFLTSQSFSFTASQDRFRRAEDFRRDGRDLRPGESVQVRLVFSGRPIDAASRVTLIIPHNVVGNNRERIVLPR